MPHIYEINDKVRLTERGREYVEIEIGEPIRLPEVYGRIVGKRSDASQYVMLTFNRVFPDEGREPNVWPMYENEIEPVVIRQPKLSMRQGDIFYHGDQPMGVLVEEHPVLNTTVAIARETIGLVDYDDLVENVRRQTLTTFAAHGEGDVDIVNARVENEIVHVEVTFRPYHPLRRIIIPATTQGVSANRTIYDNAVIELMPTDQRVYLNDNDYVVDDYETTQQINEVLTEAQQNRWFHTQEHGFHYGIPAIATNDEAMLQEAELPTPVLTEAEATELQRIIETSATQLIQPGQQIMMRNTPLTREIFTQFVADIANYPPPINNDTWDFAGAMVRQAQHAIQVEAQREIDRRFLEMMADVVPQDVNE